MLYSLFPGTELIDTALTVHLVTTQWISKGVLLRFIFYDGFHYTFAETYTTSPAPGVPAAKQIDLVTSVAIPPATILQLNVLDVGCTLQKVNGGTLVSETGAGVNPNVIVEWQGASLLCLAFVPTSAYVSNPTTYSYVPYTPLLGQPQFAIGFSSLDDECTEDPPVSPTAPNFPTQYSSYINPWAIKYSVVYPRYIASSPECVPITGIKILFDYLVPLLAVGAWSSLRTLITQPSTFVQFLQIGPPDINLVTPSIWAPFVPSDPATAKLNDTNVGPFIFCAMPGQMAVVYFRPTPKFTNTFDTPLPSYAPAEAAFLVTAPLPPNTFVYFTIDEYNDEFKGFGLANTSTGVFQNVQPSFTWAVPVTGIPAGTVVLFRNIGGSSVITVQDARGILPVGSVINVNPLITTPVAVTSLIVLGLWQYSGVGTNVPVLNTNFVTAALSDQYGGDLPVLAPGVTLPRYVFTGPAIYGPGRIFNCECLPGPVQAVMINNADFTQIDTNAIVEPAALPVFTGMCAYRF